MDNAKQRELSHEVIENKGTHVLLFAEIGRASKSAASLGDSRKSVILSEAKNLQ
jgi:hypothetical protein